MKKLGVYLYLFLYFVKIYTVRISTKPSPSRYKQNVPFFGK